MAIARRLCIWEELLDGNELGRAFLNLDIDRAITSNEGNDHAVVRSGVVANASAEATEREEPKTNPADKKLGREKLAGLKIST